MKKIYLFFILAFLCACNIYAQMSNGTFGNEWINYQQTYYKIKVAKDGLYRITPQALQQSGINAAQLSASNVQIFHNGQEIPVYIHQNGNSIEYLEFYGKKNKGQLDRGLYANPNHHFNPEYSLVNDTSAYFLTWNNTNNGLRYVNTQANLVNLPAKELYFQHRAVAMKDTIWQEGKTYNIGGELLSKGSFEFGEGYGSNLSTNRSVSILTPYAYSSQLMAEGTVRLYSGSYYHHNIEIKAGNTQVFNTSFWGDSVGTHQFQIPVNLLNASSQLTITGLNGATDKHALSYAAITYPRSFDFGGSNAFYFKMAASSSRRYLEINNFSNPGGGQTIYLYDMTNGLRIRCFWDGSRVQTDLPPSATERELLLINTAITGAYHLTGPMQAVQFQNLAPMNGNFVIVAHNNMFTASDGSNPVIEYAAYRSATGYDVVVVNVQELFDQFGYGVNMHPMAMRNFTAFIKQNWSNPAYVLLLGKGREYNAMRRFNTYDHLIPTFGFPASDNLLFSLGNKEVPELAVGRLAITNGNELKAYLQKLKEVEGWQSAAATQENRAWMKRIAHLSSGINEFEQIYFSTVLNGLKTTAEQGKFGAEVHSFFRRNVQATAAGSIGDFDSLAADGLSLITYLGHSTAGSFDFDIYSLQRYKNHQKYPLFLSLSCTNGRIFSATPGMSEAFVLTPDAGAIAFVGFTDPISLSAAITFSNDFYQYLSNDGYGKGAAELVRHGLQALADMGPYSIYAQMACHYLNYHGDPAFKLNGNGATDYHIAGNSMHTKPETVTALMDNFDLTFDISNLGAVVDTTIQIAVYQKMPDGDSLLILSREVATPRNTNTLTLTIPLNAATATGVHTYILVADVTNRVEEAVETNNSAAYSLQIVPGKIKPLLPSEFAIVPANDFELVISAGHAFAPTTTYYFEIDTTIAFDSPLLHSGSVTKSGGVIAWNPGINYMDSMVYYWRVRTDDLPVWENSSFMYKAGETGWNQSHVFQFKKDKFSAIELNDIQRQFNYATTYQEVSVNNAFTPNVLAPGYVASFFNGVLSDKCRCESENGVYVQVINPYDYSIWELPGFSTQYGAKNCDGAGRPAKIFLFETDNPGKLVAFENFLRDTIPADYYVMMYSLNNAYAYTWPNSLVNLLESKGSTKVSTLAAEITGLPWAFFYKNGVAAYPHTAEVIGTTIQEEIHLSGLMTDSWYKGAVSSTVIGPAKSWEFIDWIQFNFDGSTTDNGIVNVYGIDQEGVETKVINDITNTHTDLTVLDAVDFPFLRLEWANSDSINKTAPQLGFWRVSGGLVPELALRTDLYQQGYKDSLRQGVDFNFGVMLQNISKEDADSVLIKYQLVGSGNAIYHRVAPLAAGDTLRSPLFRIPTGGLRGRQQLLVEINPNNDQPEMYKFNNVALVDFYVDYALPADNIRIPQITVNPEGQLLTYFDGKIISNGATVSAKPEITFTVKLKNTQQFVDELSDLKIFLRHPNMTGGGLFLEAGNPMVSDLNLQTAINGDTKIATITMNLDLPWSNNYYMSAYSDEIKEIPAYEVEFEVQHDEFVFLNGISNYPNPFKSSTRFMFDLPEGLNYNKVSIQIKDLKGTLIRQLSINELGTLNSGTNKPGFEWDGTDASGVVLPAGTYFYVVVAEDEQGNVDIVTPTCKMVLVH